MDTPGQLFGITWQSSKEKVAREMAAIGGTPDSQSNFLTVRLDIDSNELVYQNVPFFDYRPQVVYSFDANGLYAFNMSFFDPDNRDQLEDLLNREINKGLGLEESTKSYGKWRIGDSSADSNITIMSYSTAVFVNGTDSTWIIDRHPPGK